jgi:hypothetical protein
LTQVVVLPTPPFWFATAIIRADIGLFLICFFAWDSCDDGHNDEVAVLLQSRHRKFFN